MDNANKNGKGIHVVRNYKDSIFRMLFRDKANLLSLYNAVNGTSHDNPKELMVNTLENAIFMGCKNDVSFVLDLWINIYEHQAGYNPNMPLRNLDYASALLRAFLAGVSIYTSKLVKIPNPRFVVFYNGMQPRPERWVENLSDAFARQTDEINLELKVKVLNINPGNNPWLLDGCPILSQYVTYVDRVRRYEKEGSLAEAVDRAVTECIKEEVLRDFLLRNRAEVVQMSLTEYDQELHMKTIREESMEEGFERGLEKGMEKGMERGLIIGAIQIMRDMRMPNPAIFKMIKDKYHLSKNDAESYFQLANE